MEAPAAELANGDGDVSTIGACRNQIDFFCQDIVAGEGRIADCLGQQLAEEQQGKYEGTNKLTDDCKKELDDFRIDRSTNINKNLPLGARAFAVRGWVQHFPCFAEWSMGG
jgi:golgi apparatus protein 1